MTPTKIRLTFTLVFASLWTSLAHAGERPNILWIVIDDMSANFGCYGETTIETPEVDQLASEGLLFTRAYATSSVCSTFRSAMITGMYQNSIGAHHHRSGQGEHRIKLPKGVRPVPELFKDAGYWTCIGSGVPGLDHRGEPSSTHGLGKMDYNFDFDLDMYDSNDWAGRGDDQPFFMQVQLNGGKIRGDSEAKNWETVERMNKHFGGATDPDRVQLPPYYPRDPGILRDWSTYLDSVRITDWHVGRVMDRLRQEELLENTLVIFFTDHGISHARGKQFLYDEGTHIPLIIRGPGIDAGAKRTDLVEHIDVAAVSLAAAGIDIPKWMEGQDILASNHVAKKAVFGARDRCGEAADWVRSVRTDRYLYIKHFYPVRPHLLPSQYKEAKFIIQRLRELHEAGSLSTLSEKLLFSPTRPPEELFLYQDDNWQIVNLAEDPKFADVLKTHRAHLDDWVERTGDPGPESPEVYVMETEHQMSITGNKDTREKYRQHTELYKQWVREGK